MNTNTNTERTMYIRVKNQYGVDRVFPADPTAVLFSRLIDQKSFTRRDLCLIEELGYTIKQIAEPLKYIKE